MLYTTPHCTLSPPPPHSLWLIPVIFFQSNIVQEHAFLLGSVCTSQTQTSKDVGQKKQAGHRGCKCR